jgi:hypothetical protein
MLSTLRESSEIFDRRFLFNALLPIGVALPATVAAVLACGEKLGPTLEQIGDLTVLAQGLLALGGLAVVWLLAGIVSSQWRGIVRAFEGYPLKRHWPTRLGIKCPGVTRHERRQADARTDALRQYAEYARMGERPDVLPTRLGNILRAAERYPAERYGIDPILLWPRLYPLLPEQFRQDYGEFAETYEFSIVLSALTTVCTGMIAAAELLTLQPPSLFAVTVIGGLLISLAFYRAGCSSARLYAEQLRTAFDVYRNELVALYPAVANLADDRQKFAAIQAVILFGDPAAAPLIEQST